MNSSWKNFVLKWFNCFRVGSPLKNINSMKEEEVMQDVVHYFITSPKEGTETRTSSFVNLLVYLTGQYPHYFCDSLDPSDPVWCDENELTLLAMLLLLHSSIHCPVEILRKNSEENLDKASQECIVSFLRKCMEYGKEITKTDLMNAIPSSPDISLTDMSRTPASPLSVVSGRQLHKKETPLKEFLSSPVARQQGRFMDNHLRERLAQCQLDLENEEIKNAELKHQLELCNAKIEKMTAKLEEKSEEINHLHETLLYTKEGEEELHSAQERDRMMSRKWREEVSDLEKYVNTLVLEIGDLNKAKAAVEQKVIVAEDKLKLFEQRTSVSEEACALLESKVKEHEKTIAELRAQCRELEMVQVDCSRLGTPTRFSAGSPMSRAQLGSPMPTCESLGQVVELQLIEKEREVQELQEEVHKLQRKLGDLQDVIDGERATFLREQETASRTQKVMESNLSEERKEKEILVQELEEQKKLTCDMQALAQATQAERDDVALMLQDMIVKHDSVVSELNSLKEAKQALELKVVQLLAKLTVAEEEREELRITLTKRGADLVSLKQERDDQLKAVRKDRENVEIQLQGMMKKQNRLESLVNSATEAKKELEDKVLELEQVKQTLESQVSNASACMEKMQEKISKLNEENVKLTSQLKKSTLSADELNSKLATVTQQKEIALQEVVSLKQERIHLEVELSQVSNVKKSLEEELCSTKTDLKKVEEGCECILSERDRVITQLDIMRQQEEDLDASLKQLMIQKKSVDSQLSKINQEKNSLEAALKSTTAHLAEVCKQKEDLVMSLTKRTKELEELSASYSVTSQEKQDVENKLQVAKETLSQVEHHVSEIEAMNKTFEARIVNLEAELSSAKAKCEELAGLVQDLEAEKAGIEEDVFGYVARLNSLNQENSSLKINVKSLMDDNKGLSNSVGELTAAKDTLEMNMVNLESIHKVVCDQKSNLEQELTVLAQEKDELLSHLNELSDLHKNLQDGVRTMEEGKRDLEQQLHHQMCEVKKYISENKALQAHTDLQSEKISVLEQNVCEAESRVTLLDSEIKTLKLQLEESRNRNITLQETLLKNVQSSENLESEKDSLDLALKKCESEKNEILCWVSVVEKDKKDAITQLALEKADKDAAVLELQRKKEYISKLEAAQFEKDGRICELAQELDALAQDKCKVDMEFETLREEIKDIASCLEVVKQKSCDQEQQFRAECARLKEDAAKKQHETEAQLTIALDKEIAHRVAVEKEMQSLLSKMDSDVCGLERKVCEKEEAIIQLEQQLQAAAESSDVLVAKYEKKMSEWTEEMKEKEEAAQQHIRMLTSDKEAAALSYEQLQSVVVEKEALISHLRQQLKAVPEAKDTENQVFREQLPMNREGTVTENKGTNTIEEKCKDKEDEKQVSALKQAEMEEHIHSLKEQTVDLRKQLAAAQGQSKLTQLQEDDNIWQLDRMKAQMVHHLDDVIAQKDEVEKHLARLQSILEEVGCTSTALFSSLPSNSEAVNEVAIMKNEVEKKLRAVDKKYAASLCGIITSTYDVLKWIEKQTRLKVKTNEIAQNDVSLFSEKDAVLAAVTSVGDMLASLVPDVRGVMNSCSFLKERCETFMRAYTIKDLNKMTMRSSEFKKPAEPVVFRVHSERRLSLPNETTSPTHADSVPWKSDLDLLRYDVNGAQHGNEGGWFGGAATMQQGYDLLQSSYDTVLKQLTETNAKLKEIQLTEVQRPLKEMELTIHNLQDEVKELRLRPSHEDVETKVKELHTLYAGKFEAMKTKMKQIVKEEVEKVEQEKIKSEKAIAMKYGKRISEFEEHVQELSSQLWELGEKLLQEQHDHRKTREQLNTLRERQRRIIMYTKQGNKSFDSLDRLLQDVNCDQPTHSASIVQNQKLSSRKGVLSASSKSRTQSCSSTETDSVDDPVSRCPTMMAPASMGLAFPEEDEDGEIFNNDYLTDMKEGRCRVPTSTSRLSELQYRNSLCPPHLKSSYPAETQFVDPGACKEDELKGSTHEERLRREVKGRGTTSYKRPGPPTPSKKGGRLSLQGKEELTPRLALREHNESTSHGTGMLRAGKTTPSRFRALFASSKVANAATLSLPKKDENSTPVKRRSFFGKKHSSKENQSASSGYSSFW